MRNCLMLFIIAALVSCGGEKNTAVPVVDVSFDEFVGIEEFVTDFDYVKLEISDEYFIGSADKLVKSGDRIYVCDKKQSALHLFDLEGHFLRTLKRVGRGQGEYNDIFDFDVYKGRIFVCDISASRILIYDDELNHQRTLRLEGLVAGVRVLDDTRLICYTPDAGGEGNTCAFTYDYNNKEMITSFWQNKRENSTGAVIINNALHTGVNREAFVSQSYDPNLYRFDGVDSMELVCRLAFTSLPALPSNIEFMDYREAFDLTDGLETVKRLSSVYSTEGYIYASYNSYKTGVNTKYLTMIDRNTLEAKTTTPGFGELMKKYPFCDQISSVSDKGELVSCLPGVFMNMYQMNMEEKLITVPAEEMSETYYIFLHKLK